MKKEYDINEVIRLRDEENLKWKEIEQIIGVSSETLRKTYKRTKEGKTSHEINPISYENQKLRGVKRKYEAVLLKGGKCEICGYNKNISALEFHHLNPEEKSFQLDARHFSNNSLEVLQEELDKCILLCANCHRETHNPSLDIDNIDNIIIEAENKKSFTNNESGKVCPVCGNRFKAVTGKKYCSKECKNKIIADKYPPIEEIENMYKELRSWEKVAQHYNLTRKIIQGIRNRSK